MSIPDIAASSDFGPDLAYDFITRPACQHALLTEDVNLLAFMYAEMKRYNVLPGSLVHALQNHDEFTYELIHLAFLENQSIKIGNEKVNSYRKSSAMVRAEMRKVGLHRALDSPQELEHRKITSFYNKESPNRLCTTTAGLIAAKLGCATIEEARLWKDQIKRGHLLLAAFNAFQPGVFAISGWDLVGALPLEEDRIPSELLNAGSLEKTELHKDYRWVNRGAYRLLSRFGADESARNTRYGCLDLPEAQALYGTIDRQLAEPDSFCGQLERLLATRAMLDIAVGQFAEILDNLGDGILGLLTWLLDPNDSETKIGGALLILSFVSPEQLGRPRTVNIRTGIKGKWPNLPVDSFSFCDVLSGIDNGESFCARTIPHEEPDLQEVDSWAFRLFHFHLPPWGMKTGVHPDADRIARPVTALR